MPESTLPRVLIVEDDDAKRYTLSRGLRASGFEVDEVATGQEALQRVRDLPDIVILDLKLPDLDGFDVCHQIKLDAHTRSVLVLELSARYSTPSDRTRGLEGGADAYLVHPVENSVLVATVRALLRARDAERSRARLMVRFSANEQRHRTVTDTATVGLCQIDAGGRCEFMNPAAEAITGYRFADVGGQVLHDVLQGTRADGSVFPAAESAVHSSALRGVPVRELRDYLKRRDGSWVPVRLSASPIMEGDQISGAVIEIKDDTELMRAERTRELFLGALGHDLRNPLQTITLGCELMRQSGSVSESGEKVVKRIVASARRMNRLIEQTLVLAQSLVDRVPLERRSCDLAPIVAEIVQDARLRDHARPIEIKGPAALLGFWDPDRLGQVVDNLVANALRHGDGTVEITMGEAEQHVTLSIHNGGPPIPPAAQNTLFDPFRRVGRAGGVGLGLYIVDQVVRAHGGTIEVSSTSEQGTTFSVTLPRGSSEAE